MAAPFVSETILDRARRIALEEAEIRLGGGKAGLDRQHRLGRLFVRERIEKLLDPGTSLLEIGLWVGHGMYSEWGNIAAGGVVTGVGTVSKRACMIIANDATVKAGSFFPATAKKVIRAQRIAFENRLPILYLVDSSGVFLPLQDEVFPDEDDFGRIFRNNAVLSAAGIPQIAAIMGNCVAGGAYLPVLCDKILMTEGSGLYLAGPALVKAAIGQTVDAEDLGGATMHAEISGTIDFKEKDDTSCLKRLRILAALLPQNPHSSPSYSGERRGEGPSSKKRRARNANDLYKLLKLDPHTHGLAEYDARDLLACLVDPDSFTEYKSSFGQSLVCGYAAIDGQNIGIVANQRLRTKSKKSGLQIGGVIYPDAADKAARFVMDCNQTGLPILFVQDVTGFMVGRDAEQSGIIRSGAKLVSAVSNSIVPKITLIIGGSFGAGHYALCGRAFDPRFIFAWPTARYAVMGADQASDTLFAVLSKAQSRDVKTSDENLEKLKQQVRQNYEAQTNIRYAAARGWIDAIIDPDKTREILSQSFSLAMRSPKTVNTGDARPFHSGVFQV